MHLVRSISVASSEDIRFENQGLADSLARISLFPNIKDFVTKDSELMIIDECSNSNIKAFYMCMLQYIVQGMAHYDPEVRGKAYYILTAVKKHLYRKNTILSCIRNIPTLRVHNDPRKNTSFTSLEMKKLLGQFFHLLLEGSDHRNRIQKIFEKYTFIPSLLNIFFRSLLWIQYDLQSAADYNQYIDDESVFNCLSGLIGLQDFFFSNGEVHCFQSKIIIENINFLNNSKSKLSILNKRVYFVNYKKQIFRDLTFSAQVKVRFRAQTEDTPLGPRVQTEETSLGLRTKTDENPLGNEKQQMVPQVQIEGKQKVSFMALNNINLKRCDSFEQQVKLVYSVQKNPENQQQRNEIKELHKHKVSIEETNVSEPVI